MVDINVWLALTWHRHPQHDPAAYWYGSLDDVRLIFCRFTMLAFLRLLTNRQVMGGSVVSLSNALALYDRWMCDPRVELVPEPRGTEERLRELLALHAAEPAAKAVADCYLAGFAEAAGAELVTFDRGLRRTSRSLRGRVILLRAVGPLRPR